MEILFNMGYKPGGQNPRPFPAVKSDLQVRCTVYINTFICFSFLEWVHSVTKLMFVIFIKVFFDCNKMLISVFIRFAVYKKV